MPSTRVSITAQNSKFNSFDAFLLFFKLSFSVFKIAHDIQKRLGRDTEVEFTVWVDNLTLSERDSKLLLSLIENPPEPTQGLLSVFD